MFSRGSPSVRQGRGSDVTGVLGAEGKCSLCSGIGAVAVPSMAWPLFPPPPPTPPPPQARRRRQLPRQPADSLLPSSGLAGIVRSNCFQYGKAKGLSPFQVFSLSVLPLKLCLLKFVGWTSVGFHFLPVCMSA